jgi:TetR/AcrR family transcriptional repressor of nem operon
VRRSGFATTSVDELCREAGVTKGAFFHHFASKDEWGAEAARYWSSWTGGFFASAEYHHLPDPLERILGYLDLREALLEGPVEAFTCYAGTTVQECFASSESIRTACADSITGHASTLEMDFELALQGRGGVAGVTASSLALHTQTVLQGAFVLAKATGGADIVRDGIAHLRRYLLLLLTPLVGAEAPPRNTGTDTTGGSST